MSADTTSVGDLLAQVIKEGKRRIVMLSAIFAVVALIGLLITILRPKMYECNATLLVTSPTVLSGPGGLGQAAAPKGTDPALVTQLVMSRKTLRELLAAGGWKGLEDPRVEDRRLRELRMRIRIRQSRPELIRISYIDTDAERCFRITNKLVQIYIREAVAPTERETRNAVAILDKQVQEYSVKLAEAHQQVLAHIKSRETAEASPPPRTGEDPSPAPVPAPAPRRQPGLSATELAALRAEEATLAAELRRLEEAQRNRPTGRDEVRFRERSLQLQSELERLLTIYTEDHPDVKRAQRELERIKAAEDRARQDREQAEAEAAALDARMTQATRARLEEVQRRIAAALDTGRGSTRPDGPTTRPETVRPPVATEDPELRFVGRDAVMTELLRQYDTTRDIYQDLLRRREIARVSLQLAEESGLGLKVQEAAEMPLTAISARLMYLVAGALFVAVMVPVGLLFAIVRFDPRLRSARAIRAKGEVPFLVDIPFVPQYRDRSIARRQKLLAAVMIGGVFAAYLVFFLYRMKVTS
jgi:uncharacterized protein involved in exopolysaccharide biosynthesis